MKFGDNVIELAIHIGKVHDAPRGIKKQNKKVKNQVESQMKCNNKEIGCYHDNAIHLDGIGKCIVKGCKCEKFEPS